MNCLSVRFFSSKVGTRRYFITGSLGQIGKALVPELVKKHGADNVMTTDLMKKSRSEVFDGTVEYQSLDVLDKQKFEDLLTNFKPTHIIHQASVLSAKGESMPEKTLEINNGGIFNVLDLARKHKLG